MDNAAPDNATLGEAVVFRAFRQMFRARIRPMLEGRAVMVYPTSPAPPPLLTAALAEQDAVRQVTMVTAIVGLRGLPEASLPVGEVVGAPVRLSLVAGPGRDRALLALVTAVATRLGPRR
jgi:amidase